MRPEAIGYRKKATWLKKQFHKGLKVKLLYTERENKCIGFIEYTPSENAWRAIDAKNYLFIHCIWVYANKNRNHGYASMLIDECYRDAVNQRKLGVAAITSDGPFIVDKRVFVKNGFKSVAKTESQVGKKRQIFNLMLKPIKKGILPKFRDWSKQLARLSGLNIIYSNQCPWVARGIKGMIEIAKEAGVKLKVFEMRNAQKAQQAPSIYATFNLVYNGRLLADHYISHHRFRNIIDKELKLVKPEKRKKKPKKSKKK
jgi:hypothetical protein